MSIDVPDFEALYRSDADPWKVGSSWYERRKRQVLLATLPREYYRSGWEVACGTGHGTVALAGRVGSLLATDAAERAVDLTRRRCAHLPDVRAAVSALPATPLDAPVDLVVAAEFLYYLQDQAAAVATLWEACAPGGHLVALHWRHRPHDAWRSGEEQQAFVADTAADRGATRLVRHDDTDFVLDVYEVSA